MKAYEVIILAGAKYAHDVVLLPVGVNGDRFRSSFEESVACDGFSVFANEETVSRMNEFSIGIVGGDADDGFTPIVLVCGEGGKRGCEEQE